MTALEKYNDLLIKPQLRTEHLSVQVTAPGQKLVEMRITVGEMDTMAPATGFTTCSVYLKPEEVDSLIERLEIAKNVVIEKNKE